MKKHFAIKITGKVQGVFFRHEAKQLCEGIGVTGFVRNEPDGSVYIEAEGPEDTLRALVSWCYDGTDGAQVDHVEVREGELQNFKNFFIN